MVELSQQLWQTAMQIVSKHVSSIGRALDIRADGAEFESRLRPDKTYYLCCVNYNVHIRLTLSMTILSIYAFE